mmetsp:Transcript_32947/g.84184  ORF Transcript_32947/g.84184 Transcript_32947/m.84184 type:complete len:128 (+) Transcript_32947:1937-2320(+)
MMASASNAITVSRSGKQTSPSLSASSAEEPPPCGSRPDGSDADAACAAAASSLLSPAMAGTDSSLRCQAKARCRGRLPIALLFTRAEGSVGVGHVLGCRSASLLILWMDELRRVALRFRVAAAASGT